MSWVIPYNEYTTCPECGRVVLKQNIFRGIACNACVFGTIDRYRRSRLQTERYYSEAYRKASKWAKHVEINVIYNPPNLIDLVKQYCDNRILTDRVIVSIFRHNFTNYNELIEYCKKHYYREEIAYKILSSRTNKLICKLLNVEFEAPEKWKKGYVNNKFKRLTYKV